MSGDSKKVAGRETEGVCPTSPPTQNSSRPIPLRMRHQWPPEKKKKKAMTKTDCGNQAMHRKIAFAHRLRQKLKTAADGGRLAISRIPDHALLHPIHRPPVHASTILPIHPSTHTHPVRLSLFPVLPLRCSFPVCPRPSV